MEKESAFGDMILNLTSEPVKKKSQLKRGISKTNVQSTNIQNTHYGADARCTAVKDKNKKDDSATFSEENHSFKSITKQRTTSFKSPNFQRFKRDKKINFNSTDDPTDSSKKSPKKAWGEVHTASLFKSNPEIPFVKVSKVQQKEEQLFSETAYADLNLHPHLVSCLLKRLNVSKLTEVQANTIPILLQKKDALVKSCTGSGKTLAYAVPIVQKLQGILPKIQRSDGIYALIIVPTRELALQSFECFSTLTNAFTWIVPGYLIGGEKKKSEKARIRKGINILISTPGRLLDHLDSTTNLNLKYISWLVIDEADKLLEQGFEESVLKILSHTSPDSPDQRQSVLLSATLSKGVENLAGISLRNPVYIDIATSNEMSHGTQELVVPTQLEQHFVITPTKLRLVSVSSFLIDKCASSDFKAVIFFSTQRDVDFHYAIFSQVLRNLMKMRDYHCNFFKLHGNMLQKDRFAIFNSFREAKRGTLLCTDVASRGLDLPCVDWIIQLSVPASAEDYVHRVGRTARIGKKGHSLLFLIPSETDFLKLMQEHKIRLEEMAMQELLKALLLIADGLNEGTKSKHSRTIEEYATALQDEYENAVYSDNSLWESAKEAFLSYVQSYASYPKQLRSVVPFKSLHLGHVAKSFCLRESPSDLGCRYAKPFQRSSFRTQKDERIPKQQKRSVVVSEFDSGLDQLPKTVKRPLKKRKF